MRQLLKQYRHNVGDCNRLFFEGYLPPGAVIEIRCPRCGKMYRLGVPEVPEITPPGRPDIVKVLYSPEKLEQNGEK